MDFANVLNQYLENVNEHYGYLKYLLSSNATVHWFSRCSIQGLKKIFKFYRYDVCRMYEHVEFEKVQECSASECEPFPMKAKHAQDSDEDEKNLRKCCSDLKRLKLFPSSDEDDDDDNANNGSLKIGKKISFEKLDDSIEKSPSMCIIENKIEISDLGDANDEEYCEFANKRAKLVPTCSTPRTPTKRSDLTASREGMIDEEITEDNTLYSSLHYFETFGKLKLRNKEYITSRFCVGECDVRLRIAYRQRISDQDIQIVMIRYENLKPKPINPLFCNLMPEFAAVANDDDRVVDDDQSVLPMVEASTANELADAIEAAEFCNSPLRTPTKALKKTKATPKRERQLTSIDRRAARNLRL